jgi:hypothetical protein
MKKVVIAVNLASFNDPLKKARQDVAMDILYSHNAENIQVVSFNYPADQIEIPYDFTSRKTLSRNSQEVIDNNRPLPYIKDILNGCMEFDCDIFGYMNSDILLHPDFFSIFNTRRDAYIFYRREIEEVDCEKFLSQKFKYIWGGDKHPGNDAFFFDKNWWQNNNNEYPDGLILGESDWDTVYRVITKALTKRHLEARELCHVFHMPKWTLDSKGALNNVKIWNEIKQKYGVAK